MAPPGSTQPPKRDLPNPRTLALVDLPIVVAELLSADEAEPTVCAIAPLGLTHLVAIGGRGVSIGDFVHKKPSRTAQERLMRQGGPLSPAEKFVRVRG